MARLLYTFPVLLLLITLSGEAQTLEGATGNGLPALPQFRLLPQNFYTKHLTFFCRQEVKWQRKLPGGLFFRLGSKDYVDALEGKGRITKVPRPYLQKD